jgi:methylphosphotriester-DNA--protein-cysteine methyltransferase
MLKILFLLLLPFSLKSQTVYKTPSGAKYHLATCSMVKNVSEEISTAKARESGLTPCKICKPQNIYAGNAPTVKKAQGESNTVQCKGKTKAGTRCKHMTGIANGYCYQHQPGK